MGLQLTMDPAYTDTFSVQPVDTDALVPVDAASQCDTTEESPSTSPGDTLREVLTFAAPMLACTLADPACSICDTALVGQVSSLGLAALGPNTGLFNFIFLIFQFIGVTVTNKLAGNSPTAPGITAAESSQRHLDNKRLVSYSLLFSAIAGAAVIGIMLGFSTQLLSLMGTNSEMMAPALDYLQIRALAAPAVMFMNVCQGVCLGQQDSVTPLKVFTAVALLNVVGDAWLILGEGMGVAGAAIATAAAQWSGALYFLRYIYKRGKQGRSVPIEWMGLPTAEGLRPFLGMATTLLSRTIFSMAAFSIITGAATMRGTVASAAHQVALQVFWLLSYFPEPLSVAAQSLISRDRHLAARRLALSQTVLRLGAGLGLTIGAACAACLLFGTHLFTADPAIVELIRPIATPAFAALMLCSMAMMMDGISIGADDYRHLPTVNLGGLVATAAYLSWTNAQGFGLLSVWWGMALVFAVRTGVHLVHHFSHPHRSAVAQALLPRFRASGNELCAACA